VICPPGKFPLRLPGQLDGCPVCRDFAERLSDLATVEFQPDYGVRAGRLRHLHHSGDGVLPGLGQHDDVAVDRVSASQVGPKLAGSSHHTDRLTPDFGDLPPWHFVQSDDDRRALYLLRLRRRWWRPLPRLAV
jgi:hypothetical protein